MSGFFVSFALPFEKTIFYPYYEKNIYCNYLIHTILRLQ